MKLIFLGKPMAGKGTFSSRTAERLNYKHISTGDLLRAEVKNDSELGKEAKDYMEKGLLVPDELIIRLLAKGLPDNNFILDGFPRTQVQAEKLSEVRDIDLVIDIDCPNELLEKRTVSRKLCKSCGQIYGLDIPPKEANVCDKCGSELYTRPDDTLETIRNRIKIYDEQTAPLIDYYKEKGLYVAINGDRKIEPILNEILSLIEKA
jgi:adenylate kinase